MGHQTITLSLQLITAAVMATLAVTAWRYRSRPGGRPFVGLMAVTAVSSILIPWASHSELVVSTWMSITILIPGIGLLFVLEYTGFSRYVNTYTVAGLAAVPLLIIPAIWIPSFQPLLFERGPLFWVDITYILGLGAASIVLLLRFVLSKNRLYIDQSVALVIGIAAPISAVIIEADLPPAEMVLVPSSFAITGVAFAVALFRFELFNFLPATRQIGRDVAIDDLQDGLLIVDTTGQIVDANRAGRAIFGPPPPMLIGRSLRTIIGDQAPSTTDRIAPTEYRTDDGRVYGTTLSDIQDHADRPVGQAIVFHDITDRQLRQTQLEVLNRVLRHNLRNKLSVVHGYAELLAERVSDSESGYLEKQMVAASELMALGERAREFEELRSHSDTTSQPVNVSEIIRRVVDQLATEFPEADVTVAVSSSHTIETYPDALEIVLQNLLQNAAEHSDQAVPQIEVAANSSNGSVELVVRDDGPGIPGHELAVLDADTETPLEHGSGLGLWVTKWAVRYLGGSLAFEDNAPRGTTASVTVPPIAPSKGTKPDPSTSM